MGSLVRRFAAGGGVVAVVAACAAAPPTVPVRPAPPSRHGALVETLAADAPAFAFADGRWEEDQGDAAFFGVAWLAHRGDGSGRLAAAVARSTTLLAADLAAPPAATDPSARLAGGDGGLVDQIQAALGLIELVSATGDRGPVGALDDFLDRLDARLHALGDYVDAATDASRSLRIYGPTAAAAFAALAFAEYALLVGGPRADARRDRAAAIDDSLHARVFGDLAGGGSARGFAFAPDDARLVDLPNVLMLAVEARLFRLTQKEDYLLEARALFAAIQPLKLADAPARYATPYADALLGVDTRDLTTLAGQSYAAWAMLLLFEITGDERFVDEADRMFDQIAAMRGPWCESQVHDGFACAPSCAGGQTCLSSRCTPERCTTGAVHHVVDGRLATPADGVVFCSGCAFEALYVLGYRRSLAGEPW